ncbi:MAG TPA: hypothetical protein VN030_00485 [Cellvibrio sp.]|nr:hypothetical protein [Cellvibrio sp.]
MKLRKKLMSRLGLPIVGFSLLQLSGFAAAETMVYGDTCIDVTTTQNYLTRKKTTCADNIKYTTSINNSIAKTSPAAVGRSTFDGFLEENQYFERISTAKSAQFFNGGDLGFGRNMNCWSKDNNAASISGNISHLACFVGNYGVTDSVGRSVHSSLREANLDNILSMAPSGAYTFAAGNPGHKPFAIVAMEYNKNKTENEVTFFAYNAAGQAVQQVELDNEKGKTIPGACLSCHGGTFNTTTGGIKSSNFLPFDFNSFKFIVGINKTSASPRSDALKRSDLEKNIEYGSTRIAIANDQDQDVKDQLKAIKGLNVMVLNQQKAANKANGEITAKINSWYLANTLGNAEGGEIVMDSPFDPNSPVTTTNLKTKVADIGCRGCHIASSLNSFSSISVNALNFGCDSSTTYFMPHGQLADNNTRDFLLAHQVEATANNCNPTLIPPIYKPFDRGYNTFRQLADVNKDGRADYCRFVGYPTSPYLSCHLAETNGFASSGYGYNSNTVINAGNISTNKFADVDGDGYQDYCRFVGNILKCNKGTNTVFSNTEINSPAGIDSSNGTGFFTAMVNVNGKDSDGKSRDDYCRFTELDTATNKATLTCNLATTSGFSATANYKTVQKIDIGFGFRQMIDVNKDGRADFCRFVNTANPRLECNLSTATGTMAVSVYKSADGIDRGYDHFRQLADVNGDGYPEFCRFVGNPATAFLSCSKGYETKMGNADDSERVRSIVSLDKGDTSVKQLIDVNNDKRADFCRFTGDSLVLACDLAGTDDNGFKALGSNNKTFIYFLKDQFSFKPQ